MVSEFDKYIGATLSDDKKYRYRLWRRWNFDFPEVIWIMLNPSTADATKDDATIRRCINFARAWGFGGIEVVNLFAYRATNPRDLFETRDPIGPDNDAMLRHMMTRYDRDLFVAAWGAFPKYLGNRDKDVLEMMKEKRLECLGVTAEGYPRHPVRLASDTPRETYWDFGIFMPATSKQD